MCGAVFKAGDAFYHLHFRRVVRGKDRAERHLRQDGGEMVRFLAERRAESPEEAKKFDRLGYVFDEEHSDNTSWVFIRTEE